MALAIERFAIEGAAHRIFFSAAQIHVRVAGETLLDLATGDVGPSLEMTPTTIMQVYCTMKPMTALAFGQLIDDGRVDLDQPVAVHLPDTSEDIGRLTPRQLLTHTAGLHYLHGTRLALLSEQERRSRVLQATSARGWKVGEQVAYTDTAGWLILGLIVEAITGRQLGEIVRSDVLEPMGAFDTFLALTDRQYGDVKERMGLNYDFAAATPIPRAYERMRSFCQRFDPAIGYSTARDLAGIYARLARSIGGDEPTVVSASTLAQMVTPQTTPQHDPILQRTCQFGLGFMVDLSQHFFGRSCGKNSFGHSGLQGLSMAFADPENDLACAMIFNGLGDWHHISESRRPWLVESLYQDLGLATPASLSQ